MAENIEITESPHPGRSAEIAVNLENTESLIASRPAKIMNIENTESSSSDRPAEIAVNLQFRHLRQFRPF